MLEHIHIVWWRYTSIIIRTLSRFTSDKISLMYTNKIMDQANIPKFEKHRQYYSLNIKKRGMQIFWAITSSERHSYVHWDRRHS